VKLEDFLDKDADHQRWALYGLFTSHINDPNAHHDSSRLKHEIKDKGPIVVILTAIIVLIEALGYA
jgi:hypothetical protein